MKHCDYCLWTCCINLFTLVCVLLSDISDLAQHLREKASLSEARHCVSRSFGMPQQLGHMIRVEHRMACFTWEGMYSQMLDNTGNVRQQETN